MYLKVFFKSLKKKGIYYNIDKCIFQKYTVITGVKTRVKVSLQGGYTNE